jgi:hypothetical protein
MPRWPLLRLLRRLSRAVAITMRRRRTHPAACALALAAVLCLAPLRTASSLLDADGPLAVTGCMAVMETLFTMVHNPPQEVCPTAGASSKRQSDAHRAAPLS